MVHKKYNTVSEIHINMKIWIRYRITLNRSQSKLASSQTSLQ